jgi:hypothetical protein
MGMPASTSRAIGLKRCDHALRDAVGIGDRNTGVNADDPDVIDGREIPHDPRKPAFRQHQRIAAGQDHLPDVLARADVAERFRIGLIRDGAVLARAHHLATEAEPAINRADMDQLEQHTIGIAMHDACDGRMSAIADRVGALVGLALQLICGRNELPRDRVVGVGGIDQACDIGRDRDGVAGGDVFQTGQIGGSRQPVADQLAWSA